MTSDNPSLNKSKQDEKQEVSPNQTNTDVVAAVSSSSSPPIPTAELGREVYADSRLPYPHPARPYGTPPMPTQATPPSRPQVTGGKGMGGRGSAIAMDLGGGIQVGGSAGGSIGSHHEVGGSSQPKRKAVDIVAPAGVKPICSICRRDFGSWKALFGHMRSHPDRQWRGCFPPPVAEQLAQGDKDQRAGQYI